MGGSAQRNVFFILRTQLVIEKGLEEAKKKINFPYVERFDDDVSYAIMAFVGNENDAHILTDALCWSERIYGEKGVAVIFGTLDYHDIIRNRAKIIRAICNDRDCVEHDVKIQIRAINVLF